MTSIRNRLALMIAAIVLAAIGVVYFYVVPQLESNLTAERLSNLRAATSSSAEPILRALRAPDYDARVVNNAVRSASDAANARVSLFDVSRRPRLLLSDSFVDGDITDLDFPSVGEALATGRVATATEPSSLGRVGEAARPLRSGSRVTHVVVFSAQLSDVQSNVSLIRRQLLIAGAIALLLAALASYLVARALSLRIKRLERAARKVAAGDFSQSIPVDSVDELGQLAVAFNDMQAQLSQLDRARKRFIAVASHELRTPIFSLGGYVELLEHERLDERTRAEFLAQIRGQIDRLTKLATDLLDLSRLEAGSLELHPAAVDLGALTRAVASEFAPALAQHRSRLEVRAAEGPVEAVCDGERVAQIVRILIDNALTHTPDGTGIVVTAARENGHAQLAVRDSGVGIKRDALARIFEPFYTSDETQGSGLGLAIARDLAERMEGRLAVRSAPGTTTFTLELPA